jgi:hypothetical protein
MLSDAGSRNAAYLAEQALEQIIRALATSEKMHIERQDAHQLDKIVRRFPDDHSEKSAIRSLVWLEAYATTFRYTMPSGQIPKAPSGEKLRAAIKEVSQMTDRIADHFGVNLDLDNFPAGTVVPMRKPSEPSDP